MQNLNSKIDALPGNQSNNILLFKSKLELEKLSVKDLQALCTKYGLSKTGNKAVIVEKISNYQEKLPAENQNTSSCSGVTTIIPSSSKESSKPAVSQKELIINDTVIQVRYEDGYVNATQLCKIFNKEFKHWNILENTNLLINTLSLKVGIPTFRIVESSKGRYGGSWIHPDLAVPFTMWLSPEYTIVVSRYMRELHLTGSVSLGGGPKSSTDLLQLQQQLSAAQTTISTTQNLLSQKEKLLLTQAQDLKTLNTAFMASKSRHNYYKFKKGGSFYIISDAWSGCNCANREFRHKAGVEGTDINRRLGEHRTTLPSLQLDFLMYTEDYELLEKCILRRFKEQRKPFLNHEYIYNISKERLVESATMIANYLKLDYHVEEHIERYNEMIRGISNFQYDDVLLDNDFEDDLKSQKDYPVCNQDTSSSSSIDTRSFNCSSVYPVETFEGYDVSSDEEHEPSQPATSHVEIFEEYDVSSDEEPEPAESPVNVSSQPTCSSSTRPPKKCETCQVTKPINQFKWPVKSVDCLECELKKLPTHIKTHGDIITPITPGCKTKTCNICKQTLNIVDFHKNKSRLDGYEYGCKNCSSKRKDCTKRFVKKPDNIPENSAFCSKCETIKLKTEFRAAPQRKSGCQAYCKPCANVIVSVNKRKAKILSKLAK